VEALVLAPVDGLLSGELLNADRLLSDGLTDPLSTVPVPRPAPVPGATPALGEPESTAPPAGPLVSLGCSPMMVSSSGKASDDSFTEVIEARQRM
jgi:hypothetical protein